MTVHDFGDTYAVLPTAIRLRKIQPGKRTILVSVLLSFMLLMSQLLRALQLDHPPRLTNVHSLQSLTNLNEEVVPIPCIKMHLGSDRNSKILPSQSCQHLPPTRGLCSLSHNLFFSKKPPDCEHQQKIVFCTLENGQASCKSPAVCSTLNHYIGTFVDEVADIKWKLVTRQNLQKEVNYLISQPKSYGFLFIKCSNYSSEEEEFGQPQYDEAYSEQNPAQYTQLFLHPPNLEGVKSDVKNLVNVNLVMIDSVSRAHFYRSLPNTVKFLEELSDKSTVEVLDFQLFQAVKQRTFESLQALFGGYVNTSEVPFGRYDIPKVPLQVSKLFGKMKEKGYRTLWIEDLCWNWEWGLVKDLKVMNSSLDTASLWQKFKKALGTAAIDDYNFSIASCDILAANGKKDPFRDLPVVCYNGRYHHEYILDYLRLYHTSALKSGQPFVTYTTTSVSHDESGIRVQGLDIPLSKYLKFASELENTLTIVFSDHGNAYGRFMESSPEAYVESFNPALFMIIPKGVQNFLGDVRFRILQDNQRRLISLIDLHYMLLEVIQERGGVVDQSFSSKYVVPGGLLSSISSSRTCRDVPLLHPNLCICKDYEIVVEPTSLHKALADYGLGILNNMILAQQRQGGNHGFNKCSPLKPVEIRKAFEVHIAVDLVIYKLDLLVESAAQETNKSLFFLILEVGRKKPGIRLISYERHSVYGLYEKCRDSNVELKLCVCDVNSVHYGKNLLSSFFFGNLLPDFSFSNKNRDVTDQNLIKFLVSPVFSVKAELDFSYPTENPCFYTVIYRYQSGISFKALNFCADFHKIDIVVSSVNMFLSTDRHSSFVLYPRDVKTLFGGIVANTASEWHLEHRIKIL